MKSFLEKIAAAVIGLSFFAGAVSVTLASFRTVQTPTYHLYVGESGTASTMRITPFPVDLNGTKLTMTDFGTTPTVTVDPKLSGVEEIESFTGITDNGDNTATLTGVSRNLLSKYPYTTPGTGRTHGSGATVVFGNNPQVYGRLAAPENTQTWTAVQQFASTSMPRYDLDPLASMWTTATDSTFVSIGKLNSTFNQFQTGNWNISNNNIYSSNSANVGVGTTSPFSKFSVVGNMVDYGTNIHFGSVQASDGGVCMSVTLSPGGCLEMIGNDNTHGGFGTEISIQDVNSGVNAYSGLALLNSLASDGLSDHYGFIGYTSPNYTDNTFGTNQATSSLLFLQNTDGAIAFMPKGGTYFYSASTTGSLAMKVDGNGFQVVSPTTTFNGIAYGWQTTQPASSTVLSVNAAGQLHFYTPQVTVVAQNTTALSTSNSATTTLYAATIPANTLTASSMIRVTALALNLAASRGTFDILIGNGSATSSIISWSNTTASTLWEADVQIAATSTTAQAAFGKTFNSLSGTVTMNGKMTSINAASPLFIQFDASTAGTVQYDGITVELTHP